MTGSKDGRIHTLDLTDPYNPQILGTATDAQGAVKTGMLATDIALNKISGMAFVAAGSTVYVIDIKDPANPRLLNTLEMALDAAGTNTPLGSSFALAERDGWVYLANQNKGLRVLNLDPPQIGIEETDPEFTRENSTAGNLVAKDYYPALGTKTFLFFGTDDGQPLDGTYEICMDAPVNDFTVEVVDNGVNLPLNPCAGQFKTGMLPTKPERGHIAVNVKWTPNPVTKAYPTEEVDIHLYAKKKNMPMTAQDKLNQCKNGSCNIAIRSNANVTLQNVLDGTAVFAADSVVSTYTGTVPNEQGFEFVQELLNQVLPRARTLWSEPTSTWVRNDYTFISEAGLFDGEAAKALRSFRRSFNMTNSAWRIGNTASIFEIVNSAVNYSSNDNTTDTFRKLTKDYGYRRFVTDAQGQLVPASKNLLDKIVDKETLVGKNKLIPETTVSTVDITADNADVLINRSDNRHDTGLYELYKNAVERFMNAMIDEAEYYSGDKGTAGQDAPKEQWIARTGEGPANGPNDPGPDAPGHGKGMSYSYGGSHTIEDFNRDGQANVIHRGTVTSCNVGYSSKAKTLFYKNHGIDTASCTQCHGSLTNIGTNNKIAWKELVDTPAAKSTYAGNVAHGQCVNGHLEVYQFWSWKSVPVRGIPLI